MVRVGDLITQDVPMLDLQGKRVAGKGVDDRACVAGVRHVRHPAGMRPPMGCVPTADGARRKRAVRRGHGGVPDSAGYCDCAGCDGLRRSRELTATRRKRWAKGRRFGIGPNFHPKLLEKIRETARTYEIKLQDEIIPGASGTDAWCDFRWRGKAFQRRC